MDLRLDSLKPHLYSRVLSKKHFADTPTEAFKYGTVLACLIIASFRELAHVAQIVARVDGKPSCCQSIGPGCSRRVKFSTK